MMEELERTTAHLKVLQGLLNPGGHIIFDSGQYLDQARRELLRKIGFEFATSNFLCLDGGIQAQEHVMYTSHQYNCPLEN